MDYIAPKRPHRHHVFCFLFGCSQSKPKRTQQAHRTDCRSLSPAERQKSKRGRR